MNRATIERDNAIWNPVTWNSPVLDEPFRAVLHPEQLGKPLKWRKPRRVLVCSTIDLFHPDVPDEFIAQVLLTIAVAPGVHQFLILTKHPKRMREFILQLPERHESFRLWAHGGGAWPLPNLWLGVTVGNQQIADERVPLLLQTPAAARFISYEPVLGPVNIARYFPWIDYCPAHDYGDPGYPPAECPYCKRMPGIDLVIVGKTGSDARSTHKDWVRSLRDQCHGAEVPFFFKWWG